MCETTRIRDKHVRLQSIDGLQQVEQQQQQHMQATNAQVCSSPVQMCTCVEHGGVLYDQLGQNLEEIEFEKSACHAAMTGNLASLERILERHPDQLDGACDATGGYSPLIYASRSGHVDVVRYLLDKGALVNQMTKGMGSTALHRAAFAGNTEIVRMLLQAGADPMLRDCDHLTALDKAQMMASESDNHRTVCELLRVHKTSVSNARAELSHSNLGNGY